MSGAPLASALFFGDVMHRRVKPRHHRLAYRVLSLLIDLDEMDEVPRRLRLLSHNRFNLFSLHDRDFGDGSGRSLKAQVEAHMTGAGLAPDGGPIRLFCMPRILRYTFNPLSVYFCHDQAGRLVAILYEVSNTFGERHSYLLPVAQETDGTVRQQVKKGFFVSPFMDMALTYGFRVRPPENRYQLSITVSDPDGPVLTAVHRAERIALTDRNLAHAFLSFPMVTMKVVAGIYWEAAKIWVKGVPLYRKPAPPVEAVTYEPASTGPARHVA